jgi:lipopolysaccharide transport system ATP-binding protein
MEQAEARLRAVLDNASILVLASHNPKVIEDMCNVVVRMEHGEVVAVERKPA